MSLPELYLLVQESTCSILEIYPSCTYHSMYIPVQHLPVQEPTCPVPIILGIHVPDTRRCINLPVHHKPVPPACTVFTNVPVRYQTAQQCTSPVPVSPGTYLSRIYQSRSLPVPCLPLDDHLAVRDSTCVASTCTSRREHRSGSY